MPPLIVAVAEHEGSPVVGGLLFFGLALLVLVSLARDRARYPFVSCGRCRGGRVGSSWRLDAWGACRSCGGKGSRGR